MKTLTLVKTWINNRKEWQIYLFIGVIVLITRFLLLDKIPFGIHVDEAGMGYDAWCLAHYGVDRWLNKYPVYLINYGGGQSALYAYLTAILIWLFGGEPSVLLFRLPGAVISCIAFVCSVFLFRKMFSKKWAIFAASLLAICPYFIMQCRFSLDCNLLVNMLTISIFLFCYAIEKDKIRFYLLAGIQFGITYYCYALSYAANTIIIVLLCLYALWTKRSRLYQLLIMCIPIFLFGLPLALMVLINHYELPQITIGCITIPRMLIWRENELAVTDLWETFHKILEVTLTRDWIDYNAFDVYFTMYSVSIPFVFIGFGSMLLHTITNVKQRVFSMETVWLIVYCIYFATGFTMGDEVNVNRINGIFFAQLVLVIYGIRQTYYALRKKSSYIFAKIICVIYAVSFLCFAKYYFVDYVTDIYPQFIFAEDSGKIIDVVEEINVEKKHVYLDIYDTFFMLSERISPYEYQAEREKNLYYKNYSFTLPEEIDHEAMYVIAETNWAYRNKLEECYDNKIQEGTYILYY